MALSVLLRISTQILWRFMEPVLKFESVFNDQNAKINAKVHLLTHTHLHPHTLTSFITSRRTYIQLFRVIKTRIFCFFTSNYPLFLPFVRKHLFHCPCRESEIAFYFVYVINRTLLFVTNYHSNAHTLTLL